MLGNIGPVEAIIIIAVLVSVFGKKKTSEMARDMGEASKEFKKFGKDYQEAIGEFKKPLEEESSVKESQPQAEVAQLVKEAEKTKLQDQRTGRTEKLTARQLDEQTIKATQPKADPAQAVKKESKTKGGEKSA